MLRFAIGAEYRADARNRDDDDERIYLLNLTRLRCVDCRRNKEGNGVSAIVILSIRFAVLRSFQKISLKCCRAKVQWKKFAGEIERAALACLSGEWEAICLALDAVLS